MTASGKPLHRLAKTLVIGLCAQPPLLRARLQAIRSANVLTVLCMHRVAEVTENSYEALSPALFDALLGWLKPRFNLTTFAALGQAADDPRPPMVLSFDDGYLDFYQVAMPILRRHGVRVNQNVTPSSVESGLPPLNVIAQDFLLSAPAKLLSEITLPGLTRGSRLDDRRELAHRVSARLKLLPIGEQQRIMATCWKDFQRFDDFHITPVMNHAQVVEVARTHEVGVHSWDHASMSVESDAFLREDARRCRTYLDGLGSVATHVYAFPNGFFRAGQPEIVRAAGFDHVLGVRECFSRPQGWLHNRFTFHGNSMAELSFRALGELRLPWGVE